MSNGIPHPHKAEQDLSELLGQERKVRDKWLSFKKKLRATKGLDPDYADQKYRNEEAKFEAAMQLIRERRGKLVASHFEGRRFPWLPKSRRVPSPCLRPFMT